MKWKQTLVMFVLLVPLLMQSASFHALAMESVSISSATNGYRLTNSIKADVKSVLNEQVPEGTRIGAVIRLYNEGQRLTRVPDYEVRLKTKDGIEYALHASAANAIAIQPKETVELSYMIVVDRVDPFSLSELFWVEVDEYVSPKLENTILSIPVSSVEWKGETAVFSNPAATKQWGEAFTIPILSAALEYKTVSLSQQTTPKGPMTVVELLAVNKSELKKAIPELLIDGKTDKKVYNGKRLEQGPLILDPGGRRYIHYGIPAEDGAELVSLTVLTPESFAMDDKTSVNYSIGQLTIELSKESGVFPQMAQQEMYGLNQSIRFDPLNKVVPTEVDVSIAALHMYESAGGGFKAAVAKFRLQNRSDRPLPVPKFQAQLTGADGSKYMAARQKTDVETLIPNISYVLYYSFILPKSETGEQLTMEILDGETVAPYNIAIATFRTQAQTPSEKADSELTLYPFNVKVNDWNVETYLGSAKDNTYKLKLDLDVNLQKEVVVDQSFPKMKVELLDKKGKSIGMKTLSFTGENRMVSGTQTVSFSSPIWEFLHDLRIYETVETPFGEADLLIKTLR